MGFPSFSVFSRFILPKYIHKKSVLVVRDIAQNFKKLAK